MNWNAQLGALVELEQTCSECPSQWEGRFDDGRALYVRYRWGILQVSVSGVGGTVDDAISNPEFWFERQLGGGYDGYLSQDRMLEETGLIYGRKA